MAYWRGRQGKKKHSGSSVCVVSIAVSLRAASARADLCWGKRCPWIMNDYDWSITICRSVFGLFLKSAGALLKAACVLRCMPLSKRHNALRMSKCYIALARWVICGATCLFCMSAFIHIWLFSLLHSICWSKNVFVYLFAFTLLIYFNWLSWLWL